MERNENSKWIGLIEAADEIGISYETLRRKCVTGSVRSRRRGEGKTSKIYVHRTDVKRLLHAYQLIG